MINNENPLKEIIMTKISNIKGNLEDEVIYLIGKKDGSEKNALYKEMEIIISDGDSGKLTCIELKGLEGYNPRIIIEKYKVENKNQILFIIQQKEEEKGIKAIIYDFNEDNLINIFNTDYYNNYEYKVVYNDNCKVQVTNSEEELIYNIDIENREKKYIEDKYDKNRKLKRTIIGKVSPIYDVLSIRNYEKDVVDILIKQKIIGENNNDVIGELINILSFDKDKFKIIETIVSVYSVKNNNLNLRNIEFINNKYDFSKVDFIESEYKSNYRLERIIEKEFLLIPKHDKLSYLYNKVNLRNFSEYEILAYLEGPKFCSEKGGTLLVVEKRNDDYIINSEIRGIIPPIIISDNKNNGYNDLIVKIMNNGDEEFRILKYNGNSYPINPLNGEKLKKGIKISGIAVISDDLFYKKGIEY